jgi:CBS domain-containing protein
VNPEKGAARTLRGSAHMTVASILRHKGHDVASVPPTTLIPDIAITLAERRIGAVLVRDAAQRVLGIVSERDIVVCLARDGGACLGKTAAQIMTTVLHTVTPQSTTEQAMTLMTNSRVRHLPVIQGDELSGIVSIGDVVKARLGEQAQQVDSLAAYVAGSV